MASGARRTVAVLIPTRNEAARLPRLLASLAAQTEQAEQVIVADASSADGTAALAAATGAVVLTGMLPGRGQQLAAACRAASASILVFAHADMVFPAAGLAALRTAYRRHSSLIGGCFGHRFAERSVALRAVAWGDRLRAHRLGRSYGDQAQFCRAAWLADGGGFPQQGLMEDIELARRLRASGQTKYLDLPVEVSGRALLARGVGRTLLRNWRLRRAYSRGADPDALRAIYYGCP